MLWLINEVLRMAPEYSEDAMVVLPLGAILDWEMGTPAGFAAFRDRQINAMIKKILTAWCEFLTSSESRYVLNNSSSGWRCTTARRAVGIEQYLGGGRGIPACLRQGQTLRGENHGCPMPYLRLRESAFQSSFPTLNLYVAGLFETACAGKRPARMRPSGTSMRWPGR